MGSPDDPVTWSTRSEAEPVAGPAAAAAAAGGAPGPGRAGSSSLRARAPQPRPPRERAGAAAPGGAWRRAGVKWAETMSFVAEAAEGVGARGTGCGGPQGARMAGEGRAASGATVLSRQPSRATRTRIESYEIQIIKNDNGKKGERRPFLREETEPTLTHPSDSTRKKAGPPKTGRGPAASHPGGTLETPQTRQGAVPQLHPNLLLCPKGTLTQ